MNRHAGVKHVRLDPATSPHGAGHLLIFDLEAMRREIERLPMQLKALANTRRHQAANKRRRHR